MKFLLHVENSNPHQAGWLACHMGLPKDCVQLEGLAKEAWDSGWNMRQRTADMEDSQDEVGHGGCHVAFLVESTQPLTGIIRHKVNITVEE